MANLAMELNAMFAAAASENRGATAPDNPFEGMLWLDTSGGATAEILKRYTVAGGWVSIMTFNITAGTYSIPSPTLVTPAMAIGADADGDMYYQAASVLARLAKGTADQHLMMNAGATAPEWATPYAVKNYTRDMASAGAPTDVAYTGAGFKPSMIQVDLVQSNLIHSHGYYDGATYGCWYCVYTGAWSIATTYIACCHQGATPDRQTASVKSFDSDGVTLTWTKQGSPSGTQSFIIRYYR